MRLCGVLFLSGLFSFAHAADTDVQFTGAVNSGTCDLTVQVDGMETNMVDLGVTGSRMLMLQCMEGISSWSLICLCRGVSHSHLT